MQSSLTSKYRDILEYIGRKRSATVAELTSVFFLSESTVKFHLRNAMRKLGTTRRSEVAYRVGRAELG